MSQNKRVRTGSVATGSNETLCARDCHHSLLILSLRVDPVATLPVLTRSRPVTFNFEINGKELFTCQSNQFLMVITQ
jgi:hypothetical protein